MVNIFAVREGKVKQAIAAYKEAQKLDPQIDIDPDTELLHKFFMFFDQLSFHQSRLR